MKGSMLAAIILMIAILAGIGIAIFIAVKSKQDQKSDAPGKRSKTRGKQELGVQDSDLTIPKVPDLQELQLKMQSIQQQNTQNPQQPNTQSPQQQNIQNPQQPNTQSPQQPNIQSPQQPKTQSPQQTRMQGTSMNLKDVLTQKVGRILRMKEEANENYDHFSGFGIDLTTKGRLKEIRDQLIKAIVVTALSVMFETKSKNMEANNIIEFKNVISSTDDDCKKARRCQKLYEQIRLLHLAFLDDLGKSYLLRNGSKIIISDAYLPNIAEACENILKEQADILSKIRNEWDFLYGLCDAPIASAQNNTKELSVLYKKIYSLFYEENFYLDFIICVFFLPPGAERALLTAYRDDEKFFSKESLDKTLYLAPGFLERVKQEAEALSWSATFIHGLKLCFWLDHLPPLEENCPEAHFYRPLCRNHISLPPPQIQTRLHVIPNR